MRQFLPIIYHNFRYFREPTGFLGINERKVQIPRPSKNHATNTFGVMRMDLVGWSNCTLQDVNSGYR